MILIDAFILTWVHHRREHRAAAFDHCADFHDLARKDIKTVGLQVHVDDDRITDVSRLHAKQHRVQQAEGTASPKGVRDQSSERVPHAAGRRY